MINLILVAALAGTICNDGYITSNESSDACQRHDGVRTLTPNNLYSPVVTWDYSYNQDGSVYSFGFSKPAEALNLLALQHPTPKIGVICHTTANPDNKNILWRFNIVSTVSVKSMTFRSTNEIWFLNSPHESNRNDSGMYNMMWQSLSDPLTWSVTEAFLKSNNLVIELLDSSFYQVDLFGSDIVIETLVNKCRKTQ